MASRKPAARTGSSSQQQRPAARSASGSAQGKSSGNGAAAGKSRGQANAARRNGAPAATSRVQANPARGNAASSANTAVRKNATQAARPAATRGATATQVGTPSGSGPVGRLFAPLRAMGWLPLATLIVSVYGFGASVYLTVAHYDTSIRLACSENGLINCQAVTTSAQSVVFGIFPVAVLGLAFFVFMLVVNSPWGWRLSASQPMVRWARLGSVIVGMGFVIYLIYVELIQINAICLWCTSVHVATFLIFVLVVFRESFSGLQAPPSARR